MAALVRKSLNASVQPAGSKKVVLGRIVNKMIVHVSWVKRIVLVTYIFVAIGIGGCGSLPPKESLTAPSPMLREVLGNDIKPIAIYGGVRAFASRSCLDPLYSNPSEKIPVGVLVFAEEGIHFRAWLANEGRYANAGLQLAYQDIAAAYSDNFKLVVIEKQESCSPTAVSYHNFSFGLVNRTAPPRQAEQVLLSLLDRSIGFPPSATGIEQFRDRAIAVVGAQWVPKLDLSVVTRQMGGISGRAEEGCSIGGAPGAVIGELGLGGLAAMPLAILGCAIGAATGAVIGAVEEIGSPSQEFRENTFLAIKELGNRAAQLPVQRWLLDAVMDELRGSESVAVDKGESPVYIRTDDTAKARPNEDDNTYLSIFRKGINNVLGTTVKSLTPKAAFDKENSVHLTWILEGGFRLLRIPHNDVVREETYTCSSSSKPLDEWRADDVDLLQSELHRCAGEMAKTIVNGFGSKFRISSPSRSPAD